MSAQPIVKISNLSLTYNPGKSTEFKALKNIHLEIFPEEFVIFFGPSGSGKSTLLYIIAGLESPTEGTVAVAGHPDISKLSEKELIEYHRSSVGMIFQAFYLIPSLTARDNVLLPMVFRATEPASRGPAVDALLDRFGITSFKDRTPARLSGGQQQRVAIARSLINDPEIVLADEPVGNLDSKNSEIVLDLIKDLHTKDKKTVILVTHDPTHLPRADRVFYIKDGEIIRMVKQKAAEKSVAKPEEPTSTHQSLLNKLALLYPTLDEARLKAKLLINFILSPYDFETLEKVERVTAEYLNEKITESQLAEKLDLPTEVGGVGLYKQVAAKLVKEIKVLSKEITAIENTRERKDVDTQLLKAEKIVTYALDDLSLKLSANQHARLVVAVKFRLAGQFTKTDLTENLDKPLKNNGVGLHSRSAQRLSKKIEILLMEEQV